MRTSILITYVCLLTRLVAQSSLPDFPFVYVVGEATHAVAPDRAKITFNIKTYHTNAAEALKQQGESADKTLSFTKQLGITSNAITAEAVRKHVVRRTDEKGKELEIIGYETVRSVTIEVAELSV